MKQQNFRFIGKIKRGGKQIWGKLFKNLKQNMT